MIQQKIEHACGNGCLRSFFIVLCTIIMLRASLLIGLGIWIVVENTGYQYMFSAPLVWIPIVVGVCIMISSSSGIYGIVFGERFYLFLYFGFNVGFLVMLLICGCILLVEIGWIQQTGNVVYPTEIESSHIEYLYTYESLLFNECCYLHTPSWNITTKVSFCGAQKSDDTTPCYPSEALFYQQEQEFDPYHCVIYQNLFVNKNHTFFSIVADPLEGGCGNGDPQKFYGTIAEYVDQGMSFGTRFVIALDSVLLCLSLGAIIILALDKSAMDDSDMTKGRVDDEPLLDENAQGIELRSDLTMA